MNIIGKIRGFVKLKKIQKSEKKSEVGESVGQAPTQICFFGNFALSRVVLCCYLLLYMFPKKKKCLGSGQSEFYSDFWIVLT